MSLRWRWALTLALVAFAAVAVVAVGASALTARGMRAEVDRTLVERAGTFSRIPLRDLAGRLPEVPRRVGGVNLLRLLVGPDIQLQVLDERGDVAFAYEDAPDLPVEAEDRDTARGGSAVVRTVQVEGVDHRMITAPLRVGAVQLARDLTPVDRLLAALRRRFVLTGVLAAAAAAAAGWWLAGRAVQPIEELTEAAEHIAATEELATAVPGGGTDEVGRLAASFSKMLGELAQSRRQQQSLVSDAGHELRTPLTGLRTNIELLRRQPDLPPDARAEVIDAALGEVDELGNLVSELVDLATDASRSPERPAEARLHDLVSPVVGRYTKLVDRTITLDGEGATVSVRPTQFERALGNLLDNAGKWGPERAPIEVTVANTRVTVRDHGPGLSDSDLHHVFDRFYRSPSARALPGSGLGLAIVKQAVEANGGTVFARNHPGGGAELGFELPEHRSGPPPE